MPTREFVDDDESKDKLPKLPDNELEVPVLIKSKGVSQIIRYGGHKEGFVITIVYNDKPLSFPAPIDWTHIHRNYHTMCAANVMDKDLVQMLEYYLIQNSNWVIGFARTSDLPNGDKSAIGASYIDDTLTQEPVQVSVPIAIRTSYGNVIVQGLIVSMSDPFQLVKTERWKCVSCNKLIEKIVINMLEPIKTPKGCSYCRGSVIAKHEFIDARTLRIQHDDVTATDSMDSLSVIVFGNDTKDIQLGERVRLVGNIKMRQSLKNKEQYTNVVLVRDIKYESRRKIEVTPEDIVEIKEFRKQGEHIEELINQFAPNVVGHRFAKLGILLAAVGAPEYYSKDPITNKKRTTVRGRINTLAIGEPGEAKTVLGNEATRLRPNSKSVSGTNTTGKAMTAMILSDPNGGRVLHLGPVALAKDAFFFINEFDKLSGEDRDAILGAMEEGRFGFNKFDANLDIEAQISVFATANPLNEKWLHPDSIDINEIPFTIRMLSRFDIIIIFRDKDTKEDDMRYAVDKTEAMIYKDVSYDFLVKYIE
jgi:DNA replicative helicase MCM subunit Mcm2 (Cdc46/Mcm family)